MNMTFGQVLRARRLELSEADATTFSLRQVAYRIEVQPSYLSRIEREEAPPPSEEKIIRLAEELNFDPDFLLALAGKVASDLQYIIRERPVVYGRLIRTLSDEPDEALHYIIDQAEQGTLTGRR